MFDNIGIGRRKMTYGNNEVLLIVDDDTDVLRILTMMLRSAGYRVIEASSPAEALKLVSDVIDQIDLVITDMIMPGMNGKSLASKLKTLRSDIKVLFISGYGDDVMKTLNIDLTNCHFAQKPLDFAVLTSLINNILTTPTEGNT